MERQLFRGHHRSMGESDTRQRDGRSHRAGGPVFDLFASKLLRPLLRPGTVRRSLLIERLARGDPRPIVSVVAPPGYGKTTLLSQWAERNGQAFAWVSVEEGTTTRRCCSVTSQKRLMWSSRSMSEAARFQETLRRLAMIDTRFVEDEAGLGLGL